eukprot:11052711-Prorocentrum_lima.AAC.1
MARQIEQSFDMTGIMGPASTPPWYSPSAQNLPQEHADLAILDMCKARGSYELADNTWWSVLAAEGHQLVRNKAANGD